MREDREGSMDAALAERMEGRAIDSDKTAPDGPDSVVGFLCSTASAFILSMRRRKTSRTRVLSDASRP